MDHSTLRRYVLACAAALTLWPAGAVSSPVDPGTRESAMAIQHHSVGDTRHRRGLDHVQVEGIELEFEVRGAPAGEAVLFVHAGVFADWFVPLLDAPSLTERYRLIHYHRVGYAGSSHPAGPTSIADQAAHARALLRHLGVERAHVVGHSSGGNIALQLALDAPEVVGSVTLLEAAGPPDGPSAAAWRAAEVGPAVQRFQTGDRAGAVDAFMQAVAGPGYREVVERTLPAGALAQAEGDADSFFGVELPSLRQWSMTPEIARRVTQPVLAVLGAESAPAFAERHELWLAWLPNAEPFVLPGATHLLHLHNPGGMAEALADFFARHPIATRGQVPGGKSTS